jgi:hypothetical protein
MIFINLSGGLGNQIFQYAAGLTLQNYLGGDLTLDVSSLNKFKTKRDFMLSDYVDSSFVDFGDIPQFQRWIMKFRLHKLIPSLFPWYVNLNNINNFRKSSFCILDDYFQEFKKIEFGLFKLKELNNDLFISKIRIYEFYKNIINTTSLENILVVHFRAGDYKESNNLYPLLNQEFYNQAISTFNEKNIMKIIVFSDENDLPIYFKSSAEIVKISTFGFSDQEEFLLMSQFQNYIIANSTFSFLASIFSPCQNKVVVAPKNWINNPENAIWNNNCTMNGYKII